VNPNVLSNIQTKTNVNKNHEFEDVIGQIYKTGGNEWCTFT